MSFRLRGCLLVFAALAAATRVGSAADGTAVRFRISGLDSAAPDIKGGLGGAADPKAKKAIEKAIRDTQKFAGRKQRITCQDCVLKAVLTIGREIDQASMRSQSGVAETAGLVATPPYDVPLDKNLAEIAKAIVEADYKHKITPRLQVGLPLPLNKKEVGRTLGAVRKIDGVAASGTSYDATEGTLWIGVDPKKELPLRTVVATLQGAGIDVGISDLVPEKR